MREKVEPSRKISQKNTAFEVDVKDAYVFKRGR